MGKYPCTALSTITALNPAAIQPMSIAFSDPPTQAELLQGQDQSNALLSALKHL